MRLVKRTLYPALDPCHGQPGDGERAGRSEQRDLHAMAGHGDIGNRCSILAGVERVGRRPASAPGTARAAAALTDPQRAANPGHDRARRGTRRSQPPRCWTMPWRVPSGRSDGLTGTARRPRPTLPGVNGPQHRWHCQKLLRNVARRIKAASTERLFMPGAACHAGVFDSSERNVTGACRCHQPGPSFGVGSGARYHYATRRGGGFHNRKRAARIRGEGPPCASSGPARITTPRPTTGTGRCGRRWSRRLHGRPEALRALAGRAGARAPPVPGLLPGVHHPG